MVVDEELIRAIYQGPDELSVEVLDSWEEEADNKVINHTMWSVNNGRKRVVVLSNDCDTLMLLLRYMEKFMSNGLEELWLQYGGGERKRMIPLHTWYNALGARWCKTLIKVHGLTGNDFLNYIGTKLAAIKSDPLYHLAEFGECAMMVDHEICLAEKYLVNVWNGVRSKTDAHTFDELRLQYHRKATPVPLEKFPPTSSVIREHLKRGYYVIRKSLNLLAPDALVPNPVDSGWFVRDGFLLPTTGIKRFPEELMSVCGCKGKCGDRCKCYKNGQKCVIYCHKGCGDKCTNKL